MTDLGTVRPRGDLLRQILPLGDRVELSADAIIRGQNSLSERLLWLDRSESQDGFVQASCKEQDDPQQDTCGTQEQSRPDFGCWSTLGQTLPCQTKAVYCQEGKGQAQHRTAKRAGGQLGIDGWQVLNGRYAERRRIGIFRRSDGMGWVRNRIGVVRQWYKFGILPPSGGTRPA